MSNNKNQNLSKEKLLAEIQRLKKELKDKKHYGISFEPKKERVAEMCKEKLPVLKEVKSKEIITDKNKPVNLLIEGDNYHALSVLNYTHAKKVDVIYIDPPYNTGNKDFIFNDHYVDKEDAYRHSKWLSFMEKRLRLARNLLKDTGVIFISIDDHELAQLKLLMDDIFGNKNFKLNFIWIASTSEIKEQSNKEVTTSGANLGDYKNSHEYILVYTKSNKFRFSLLNSSQKYINSRTTKNGNNISIIEFPKNLEIETNKNIVFKGIIGGLSEPVEIINKEGMIFKSGKLQNNVKIRAQFANPNMLMRLFRGEEVYDKKGQQIIKVYFTKTGLPYIRKIKKGNLVTSILSGFGDTSKWRHGLMEILAQKEPPFNYPKPFPLIMKLIKLIGNRKAIVLDFFAGSGTTGHAVLELNKEDGGNRQFILCTNNENNICSDVCYPRIKKVIQGYKNLKGEQVEGLGGNLKYFKTDFVDKTGPSDDVKYKLVERSTEMLCLKEGTFEKVLDRKSYKVFKNHSHFTGILFNLNALDKFKKEIKRLDGKISIYIFSLGRETYQDEFRDLKNFRNISFQLIPESILEVYRKIFGENS